MSERKRIEMSFPGGRKVLAKMGAHEILTDQPTSSGGDDAAPSPWDLFLASIGACAGFYALAFFQKRELATDGLRVVARPRSEDGTLADVEVEVTVPDDFPEKYREPLLRSIEGCSVKKAIAAQPTIRVDFADAETASVERAI